MVQFKTITVLSAILVSSLAIGQSDCGIIKDAFQKLTGTNNQTEDVVKQSAPICGSGVFSTPDEASLSPQLIFITNKSGQLVESYNSDQSQQSEHSNGSQHCDNEHRRKSDDLRNTSDVRRGRQEAEVAGVAKEFTFHADNVTLGDLERNGFNREAPVTFLIHGFTSGYPLQAWISAIVEGYTIDRETSGFQQRHLSGNDKGGQSGETGYNSAERRRISTHSSHSTPYGRDSSLDGRRGQPLRHNLFIVNWNYAARGILYPRAVANIPIVASYVTRFINNKLLDEARVSPDRIQLIGHSLGAHLAGFIGKNTRQKVGRIYGLDPAGPCFGAISGPLYPSSRRLAPGDAQEVITVQTNSDLLGIGKPLGRYSIFVEGGASQPGCKGGGVLKSLHTLTWDGGDFDALACSHSRAPNLLTYRHEQSDHEDDCQMVAYACKDWQSFLNGHCGVCESVERSSSGARKSNEPMQPVACKRIGLDWQYYKAVGQSSHMSTFNDSSSAQRERQNKNNHHDRDEERYENYPSLARDNYRRNRNERNRRETKYRNSSNLDSAPEEQQTRRRNDQGTLEATNMFLRTGDTQPYCAFHYQVVLELNQPFQGKGKPPMAIILQDSEQTGEQRSNSRRPKRRGEQNSLSSDEFGNKFNDKTYTHLLTSNNKLKIVDQATLIFRNGLEDGHRLLKSLQVNYMSHSDANVRRRLSSRLCPVKIDTERAMQDKETNRFHFKPCDSLNSNSESHHSQGNNDNTGNTQHSDHNESEHSGSSGYDNNQSSNYKEGSGNYGNQQQQHGSQNQSYQSDYSSSSYGREYKRKGQASNH